MKINVLKAALWQAAFCFFGILGFSFYFSISTGIPFWTSQWLPVVVYSLLGVSLLAFVRTLNKAGIWIAHSLPSSLKYGYWSWTKWAVISAGICILTWALSYANWMPIAWKGFVVPTVFTLAFFTITWSLGGPILSWSSRQNFSRVVAFLVFIPLFVLSPIISIFISSTAINSYFTSYPGKTNPIKISQDPSPASIDSKEKTKNENEQGADSVEIVSNESFQDLQVKIKEGQPCTDSKKLIFSTLGNWKQTTQDASKKSEIILSLRAIKCAQIGVYTALPYITPLIESDNVSSEIKATATIALTQFNRDVIKNLAHILIKNLNANEDSSTIRETALYFKKIGGADEKFALIKLENLFKNENHSIVIGKLFLNDFNQRELVQNFVVEGLTQKQHFIQSLSLVCDLTDEERNIINPDGLLEGLALESTSQQIALKALKCFGDSGTVAILNRLKGTVGSDSKVSKSHLLEALLQVVEKHPSTLEVLEKCQYDTDPEVRVLCGKNIGQFGALALPTILKLLKHQNIEQRQVAQAALSNLRDNSVIQELLEIQKQNSGWLSNKDKLKTAQAIQEALTSMK